MKKYILISTIVICTFVTYQSAGQTRKEIGNLIIENIPDIPDELRERLNQYQNTRGASSSSWSPNGNAMLMNTRFAETSQIHIITTPGGAREQLTFFKEPVGGGNFCPNPTYNGFMFTKDIGGNEFRQLHWFDLSTGKYEMISDGGKTQNSNVIWSEDGTQFIYTSTRRNRKDYDLFLGNMKDIKNVKPILEHEGLWYAVDWSKDSKKVIVGNYISANKSFLYILDLATDNLEQINATAKDDVAYGSSAFSSDGNVIYYVSNEGGEFMTLKYYDIATKKSTTITTEISWDIDGFIINKSRNTIIFTVNENGIYKLFKLETATNKYILLSGLPSAILYPVAFHPNGTTFSFIMNSTKSPSDIYTYDLLNDEPTQWTYSEVGGLDNSKFVTPTLIEYETFDTVNGNPRKIPAFYYKPENAKGKIPVVIEIHGGPEGQSIPYFSSFRSFLTNELSIAVIEPNVRGSSGYGKSYLKLDNGYKREESVQDIGKLIDWIANQPDLDASRIAVTGGSYGGYMVLASLTNYNDKIRCGVDVVGISNFITFLQNTEDYRKDLRRVEYGDERDPKMKEFLTKISPANNLNKITKPLLIVQGQNDPRVPASESEQIKTKMQEKGNKIWYILAKDEGHGFSKKENWTFQQLATILFLQKYLLN
ncbi:MAG: prolyl oligopeptidase family serine peptidase [Bacteroidales bacterium]|nr:prolyl oligopeptidase family serine peptidase [Bacteroidales bacterium]